MVRGSPTFWKAKLYLPAGRTSPHLDGQHSFAKLGELAEEQLDLTGRTVWTVLAWSPILVPIPGLLVAGASLMRSPGRPRIVGGALAAGPFSLLLGMLMANLALALVILGAAPLIAGLGGVGLLALGVGERGEAGRA